jgi:hypothetical protein
MMGHAERTVPVAAVVGICSAGTASAWAICVPTHDAPTRALACQSAAAPSAAMFALHTAVTWSGVDASASLT